MSEVFRIVVTVTGIVQGVGYRYFVCETARKLKITGWVTNLSNGSVETEAEGIQSALDNFVNELKKGPEHARVDQVVVTTNGVGQNYKDFRIR